MAADQHLRRRRSALATALTDALKLHGAECTTMCWPQQADHAADAERLRSQLDDGGFTGVVVLTRPSAGNPDEAVCRTWQ